VKACAGGTKLRGTAPAPGLVHEAFSLVLSSLVSYLIKLNKKNTRKAQKRDGSRPDALSPEALRTAISASACGTAMHALQALEGTEGARLRAR
jgi:hypothetical protein